MHFVLLYVYVILQSAQHAAESEQSWQPSQHLELLAKRPITCIRWGLVGVWRAVMTILNHPESNVCKSIK